MAELSILVDYDNVERSLLRAGPVSLAKAVSSLVPLEVIAKHTSLNVRLYGGWRSGGKLTVAAQRIVPDIRLNSPTVVSFAINTTVTAGVKVETTASLATPANAVVGALPPRAMMPVIVSVTLADTPIGATIPLEETLVRDRSIRKFRTLAVPWTDCANTAACGFSLHSTSNFATACTAPGCIKTLGDILVRDEQKMVDTMIVADIAHLALRAKASDVVVVSSDTDMWPGVLLALRAGCSITHIHTKQNWRTQRHLLNTIEGPLKSRYKQLSV